MNPAAGRRISLRRDECIAASREKYLRGKKRDQNVRVEMFELGCKLVIAVEFKDFRRGRFG
jgi:hypothetical protein